jgi:TolA-binding protein
MDIKELENKVKDIQFQLDDVKNTRDPLRANQRIDLLQQQLEQFGVKITEMDKKIESFGNEDKYIELFTDDEFKLMYQNSGLLAKDVAALIKKNNKFKDIDTSAPAISKIVSGTIGSLELRSYLGKQFRFAISQRQNI